MILLATNPTEHVTFTCPNDEKGVFFARTIPKTGCVPRNVSATCMYPGVAQPGLVSKLVA